jgi:RNA polymerase sigma-70 factor (ECF subfamily)
MDLSDPTAVPVTPNEPTGTESWIEPAPDAWILPVGSDPAGSAVARESVQLAFLALLQQLPSRQRAVFLLREVVGLQAQEISDLMGRSPASVNSALQRARATLAARREAAEAPGPVTSAQTALLSQYVAAFEGFDLDALAMLLHVDATLSMPPYKQWMRGPVSIRQWLEGPGVGCRGSRLIRTFANDSPAFGQYRPSESGSGFDPWALHVLEIADGQIAGINAFRATNRLFEMFGLPEHVVG